jgi:hemerythrin-like domain-containing protein
MSVAVEMANVHNVILRGLNSIYLQCPYVKASADVADFMLYIKAWADTVHHHHSLEESVFFPGVERIAKEAGLPESLMSPNVDQHHLFEPKLLETIADVKMVMEGKQEYKSERLKKLIDGFAPLLTQHLHDEIDTLIKLEKCDGEKIKKLLAEAADQGQKTADTVSDFEYVLLGKKSV